MDLKAPALPLLHLWACTQYSAVQCSAGNILINSPHKGFLQEGCMVQQDKPHSQIPSSPTSHGLLLFSSGEAWGLQLEANEAAQADFQGCLQDSLTYLHASALDLHGARAGLLSTCNCCPFLTGRPQRCSRPAGGARWGASSTPFTWGSALCRVRAGQADVGQG